METLNSFTKPRLGLCCMPRDGGFETMRLSSAPDMDRWHGIVRGNIQKTVEYAALAQRIGAAHYRLSSSVFPLLGAEGFPLRSWKDSPRAKEIEGWLRAAHASLSALGISFSSHPGQYTVLFTDDERILTNSINDLEVHASFHDALGLPDDYSNPINIHPTRSFDKLSEACDLFYSNFLRLSPSVRGRLVLENCDKGFWNCQNLFNFSNMLRSRHGIRIPLTYDNLHDECNNESGAAESAWWIERFAQTWDGHTPIFHFSQSVSNTGAARRSHADFPRSVPWFVQESRVWEVELKGKDLAIQRIFEICERQQLANAQPQNGQERDWRNR